MRQTNYGIYKNIQALQTTMGKLLGTDFTNAKEAYRIKRLGDEVELHFNTFRERFAMVHGEAEWEATEDEKGENIPMPERVATNQAFLDKKIQELFQENIEFKWAPIPEETLDKVSLAPADFEVLTNFIDEKKLAHSAANGIMVENLKEWDNVETGEQVAN
jgi:hypothetical protein